MKIDLFRPSLPKSYSVMPYLKRIDSSAVYSNFGPLVGELHTRLAEYFGVHKDQLVTLTNATLALEAAVAVIHSNDSWLTPSYTFTATNLSLKRASAKFVFGDIDKNWRLQDHKDFLEIMDVCPFGDSLDLTRFDEKKRHIIVDAAASFDALKDCGPIINDARVPIGVVVSFHATKTLPGAEGGLFFSNSKEWVNEVRQWSTFGMKGNRSSEKVGTNAKMHEYSAAIILASLDGWNLTRELWLQKREVALEISEKVGLAVQPSMYKPLASPYWIISAKRDHILRIEKALGRMQISSRRWWEYGCHKMQAFKDIPQSSLINTEKVSAESLGLPFHLNLSRSDFSIIERVLGESLN